MMEKTEAIEYFARMHQIIDLPEYNNALIVGQYLMEAIKDKGWSLPEIGEMLRSLKSRVCLIGLPLWFFKNEFSMTSKMPHTDKIFKYALWVELNGKKALDDLISRNNINDIDASLQETGFLTVVQNKE